MVKMYNITRKGKFVGNIRASDLTNHGDLLERARYELAQMVGGNLAKSILRGKISQYSDGSLILGPADAKGKRSVDEKGNLISYIFTPYDFEPMKGNPRGRKPPRLNARSAKRHTRKANTPKRKRQWGKVYRSAVKRGANEPSAIRQANAAVKKTVLKRNPPALGKRRVHRGEHRQRTALLEAIRVKGGAVSIWYWNGHALENKEGHAFIFPNSRAARVKAKEIRNQMPSGFKVMRVREI